MSATVSVVIPCRDAAAFVGSAIRSALDQTHRPREVLVVDDGSTDSSAAVAEAFGPPVRVIRQGGAGVAAARNRAVAEASGQWVAFLDADDMWRPEKLARQLERARDGCELVYCDAANFGDCDTLPRRRAEYSDLPEGNVFEPLLLGNFVTTSGVLALTAMLKRLRPFQHELTPAEDWACWLESAGQTSFACVRDVLVDYRVHAGGISRNAARMRSSCRGVLAWARTLPAAAQVRPRIWRKARANAEALAALRHELAGEAQAGARAYAAAARIEPFRGRHWKGLVRCLLA